MYIGHTYSNGYGKRVSFARSAIKSNFGHCLATLADDGIDSLKYLTALKRKQKCLYKRMGMRGK